VTAKNDRKVCRAYFGKSYQHPFNKPDDFGGADIKFPSKKASIYYGWVIALLGCLTVLGAHGFGRFAYPLLLPYMQRDLNLNYFQMGLLATGNFIGYLIMVVAGGVLASKYGPRIVISASAVLMGASMIWTGLSSQFEHIFVARMLTGLGNGGAYLPSVVLPSIWFPSEKRGRITGMVVSSASLGFALSSVFVTSVLSAYGMTGWRYCWHYFGVTLLVIAAADYLFIRNKPESLVETERAEGSSKGESDAYSPFKWNLVYRNRNVWFVGLLFLAFGLAYSIYLNFFVAYLQALMWPENIIALIWFMIGALGILSGFAWGWLSDVLGRKFSIFMAFSTLFTAFLLSTISPITHGLYCSAILFGISMSSIPTVAVVTAGEYVAPTLRSTAAGFVTSLFGVGQLIGPALGGYIIDSTKVFSYSFLIAAICSFSGLIGALKLKNPKKSENMGIKILLYFYPYFLNKLERLHGCTKRFYSATSIETV